jgi:hypothetical protein
LRSIFDSAHGQGSRLHSGQPQLNFWITTLSNATKLVAEWASMKRLFLTGVAALFLATGTAHASEILIALMVDDHGLRTVHQVSLKNSFCVTLVNRFVEQSKNGSPVTLTLPEPDFTGRVLEASCVMPDGSIGAQYKEPSL